MKKYFLALLLLLPCRAAFAADDCSKNSDACAAGAKKTSPFIAASMRESVPPHVEAAVKNTSAAVKQAAAPAAAPSSAAAPSAAEGLSPAAGGKLSSPAWLLLVLAGFSALYFYLRGATKKRRRK